MRGGDEMMRNLQTSVCNIYFWVFMFLFFFVLYFVGFGEAIGRVDEIGYDLSGSAK